VATPNSLKSPPWRYVSSAAVLADSVCSIVDTVTAAAPDPFAEDSAAGANAS
jgi:hypothetical protein